MAALTIALWAIGGALLLVGLILVLGASRYHTLNHRIGAFTCDYRKGKLNGREPKRFTPGVAAYSTGQLEWYSAWSMGPAPSMVWPRAAFTVSQRQVVPGRPNQVVVRCHCAGADFDLLMTGSAYAGLASWLEAAPTPVPEVI